LIPALVFILPVASGLALISLKILVNQS